MGRVIRDLMFVGVIGVAGVAAYRSCGAASTADPTPPVASPARRASAERATSPTYRPAAAPALAAAPVALDPRQQFGQAMAAAVEPDDDAAPARVIARIEDSLAATGSSAEAWTRDATAAFRNLEGEMRRALNDDHLRVSTPRCFAAGCVVTVEYPAGTDVRALAQSMVAVAPLADWPGGKMMSPSVIGADAMIANRWVLVRPDEL